MMSKRMVRWLAVGFGLAVAASFVAAVVRELRRYEEPVVPETPAEAQEKAQPQPVA